VGWRFAEVALARINFYVKIQRGRLRFYFALKVFAKAQNKLRRLNFPEKLSAGGRIETPCLLATF